ncbi:MAG: hypothetical protein H0T91_11330 [Propionibacteriaceae bacterium]|nr:hypothetical protein [Propionibacteriaceae bacterium]
MPASIDSAGCAVRRSDALGLTGFTVLPIDLRLAAILVASGAIVSAAMWFVPLLVGPAPLWRLITVTLLALVSSAHAFVDMWWYVGGHRLGGSNLDVVSNLSWLVLALMTFTPAVQFAAAESLASRRRGGGRLALLLIGIVVAGPVGIFADSLSWRAAYNSPGYAPGEGWLRAAALLVLGGAIIAASAGRARPGPDRPDFTLAA